MHKKREAIDEQQKQMQSGNMTAEERLARQIIKLGDNPEISWADYKKKLFALINQFKAEICKKPHELLQKCLDDNYELGNGRELKPEIRDEIEKYLTTPEPE